MQQFNVSSPAKESPNESQGISKREKKREHWKRFENTVVERSGKHQRGSPDNRECVCTDIL